MRVGSSNGTNTPAKEANFWNVAFADIATLVTSCLRYSYPHLKIGGRTNSELYICETTSSYVEGYTIPNRWAILEDVLLVGMCVSLPWSFVNHPSQLFSPCDRFPNSPSGMPSSIVDSLQSGRCYTLQLTRFYASLPPHTPMPLVHHFVLDFLM